MPVNMDWAQFGFAAAMSGVLVYVILHIVKWGAQQFATASKRQEQQLERVTERYSLDQEKVAGALRGLEDAIRRREG